MPVITPANIQVARGNIWLGVTVPATPPVPLINGEPATGTSVGATMGPASVRYRPTALDIIIQQTTVIVDQVITAEDLRIEFTLGEMTYNNLVRFFMGATGVTTYVTLGGRLFPAEASVLLVSPRRNGTYFQAMLYRATFSEERELAAAREAVMAPRVISRGLGDLSRTEGDQVGFIHPAATTT